MMNRNNLNMKIELTQEQKKEILEQIESFYLDEREEKIGIIEKHQIMDLFLENVAPIVYNKALDDAQRWYREIQGNMESDYYMLYKDIR